MTDRRKKLIAIVRDGQRPRPTPLHFALCSFLAASVVAYSMSHHRPTPGQTETEATLTAMFNPMPLLETIWSQPDLTPLKAPTATLPPVPAEPEKLTKTVEVSRGDTLMQLLTKSGADAGESHQVITALKQFYDPKRLQLGQEITLTFERIDNSSLRLASLNLHDTIERAVEVTRDQAGYSAQEIIREFDQTLVRAGGTIAGSLYASAMDAGLPLQVMTDFVRLFSFDVDFQREVHPGDSFDVYFEHYLDDTGKPVKTGRILAASLTLRGQPLRYYLYQPASEPEPDYFNERGQSARKALLRTPIDGARLTSSFGMRNHPILGYSTMHKGIDFGAASGTPIQAAGDGRVEVAGRNGSYGNYVRIRHNSTYDTAYAHMSRIAVKPGQRVKQGDIVGYVGTTGRSTGPHLHYEVLRNNVQVNPLSIRLPTGRNLDGKELAKFLRIVDQLENQVAGAPLRTWLADHQ